MRIESPEAWYARQKERGWHKWFAWLPVKISSEEEAWLEIVERRVTGMEYSTQLSSTTWEYRELKK